MRRFIALFFLIFTFSGAILAQQLSDEQVIQYVKDGQKQGKSQKQMTSELMRRGVTKEQVERIKTKNEESQNADVTSKMTKNQKRERYTDSTQKARYTDSTQKIAGDSLTEMESKARQPIEIEEPTKKIFGRNIFTSRNLSFEPNANMATPVNYRLGPGDEVIIDVWGASENMIRQTISPEGSIQVSTIGPVYLSGMTIKEANAYLQREFTKIYSGISGNTSQVQLTLGKTRSIQINMMGEVGVPGTYTLSSFSSVFHALYSAGGVNSIGSLRSIQVMRGGRKVADVDVYDYILKGKMNDDIRLMEGDVILVPPYDCLVDISGKVKRPMYYEVKKRETISTLLKYVGGFTGDAYTKTIRLLRLTGREKQIFNVDEMDYSIFKLNDGDVLTVDSVLDRFENRVEVRGAVYREGMYQINGGVNTVKQLIQKAEGLRGDAFLDRAQLQREHDDLTLELIPIDLKGMLNGTVVDLPLLRNDVLYIPSIHELREEGMLTIHGEVARPGSFLFAEKTTIEDLVIKAGGLLESASTARVDVSRRIKDPKNIETSNIISKTFTFELKDGFLINGDKNFYLEPFDEVYVRRSPAYQKQRNVAVDGEVLFSGSYSLTNKNERLSDLVNKAGGITVSAYIKGARLLRKMTEEELRRKADVLRLTHSGNKDSVSVEQLEVSDFYAVGINLDRALAAPGSDDDMVLREGDMLFVPEYVSTVKINGAVMYPNTVSYDKNKKLSYYINQAGGYGDRAKKKRAYVIYLNGSVSRLKSGNSKLIEPGCEIVVPTKSDKKRMSPAEILGMGSSAVSLATMVATMANLFK
ncbi:MAG: SLBB domain-containing protein [Bacteroides sp.]